LARRGFRSYGFGQRRIQILHYSARRGFRSQKISPEWDSNPRKFGQKRTQILADLTIIVFSSQSFGQKRIQILKD
jgi:hypothetical protein